MNNFRSTFLFASIVAGIAFYAYKFEYLDEKQKTEAIEEARRVVPLETDWVKEIELNLKGQPLRLVQKAGVWYVTEPLEDLAEAAAVENVLHTLTTTKSEEVVSGDNISWEEYGLSSPKGEISAKTGSREISFEVSTVMTSENEFYIRPKGQNKVLLVPSSFGELLEKPLRSLRDKNIFRQPLAGIHRVEMVNRGKAFTLLKKEGRWVSQEGERPLKENSVIAFLTYLKRLKADNFVSEKSDRKDRERFSLQKPRLRISLIEEGRQRVLLVSPPKEGKLFAHISQRDVIFEIHPRHLANLSKQLRDFLPTEKKAEPASGEIKEKEEN